MSVRSIPFYPANLATFEEIWNFWSPEGSSWPSAAAKRDMMCYEIYAHLYFFAHTHLLCQDGHFWGGGLHILCRKATKITNTYSWDPRPFPFLYNNLIQPYFSLQLTFLLLYLPSLAHHAGFPSIVPWLPRHFIVYPWASKQENKLGEMVIVFYRLASNR